jgi:hypothetical protein
MPNAGRPNFIQHILLDMKTQIDPKTVVGDFNTHLESIGRASSPKFNKVTIELNDSDKHRVFYPTTARCTFSSSAMELSPKRTTS